LHVDEDTHGLPAAAAIRHETQPSRRPSFKSTKLVPPNVVSILHIAIFVLILMVPQVVAVSLRYQLLFDTEWVSTIATGFGVH